MEPDFQHTHPMELPHPFILEKKLGQGGMAEVFRARVFGASGFEKVVVIKTLREELVGTPELERRFLEEARLSHHNLVQAHFNSEGIVTRREVVELKLTI